MVKKILILISFIIISSGVKTRCLENKLTIVPLDNKIFINQNFADKSQN